MFSSTQKPTFGFGSSSSQQHPQTSSLSSYQYSFGTNTNQTNDTSKPSYFSSTSYSNFGQGNNTSLLTTSQQNQNHQQNIDSNTIANVESKIINCIQESKMMIMDELKKINMSNLNTQSHTTLLSPQKNTYVHTGITCDRCMKNSFSGDRYKCLFCKDFDLCEDCEKVKNVMVTNIGAHTRNHAFIKIENTETFLNMMSSVSNAFTL